MIRCILVLSVALLTSCSQRKQFDWHGGEGKTLSRVEQLHQAIKLSIDDQDMLFLTLPIDVSEVALQLREKSVLSFEDIDSVISDTWGNDLAIAYVRAGGKNQDIKKRLLVWSFGRNGINEFGQGDDISNLSRDSLTEASGR
tara:strand:- start:48 stop:473 length:426 start_codon:yes stop_codon:yes gene_type:complete